MFRTPKLLLFVLLFGLIGSESSAKAPSYSPPVRTPVMPRANPFDGPDWQTIDVRSDEGRPLFALFVGVERALRVTEFQNCDNHFGFLRTLTDLPGQPPARSVRDTTFRYDVASMDFLMRHRGGDPVVRVVSGYSPPGSPNEFQTALIRYASDMQTVVSVSFERMAWAQPNFARGGPDQMAWVPQSFSSAQCLAGARGREQSPDTFRTPPTPRSSSPVPAVPAPAPGAEPAPELRLPSGLSG